MSAASPADVDSVAHLVVEPGLLADGAGRYQLDDANAHHLHRVLRVRSGELVTLTDGAGHWVTTVVEDANQAGWLSQSDSLRVDRPERPLVEVAFALTKADKPEWVIQKLTELGANSIVPLVADRSVVRWDADKGAKNLARFQTIAREALQQSRQTWLPAIASPMSVRGFSDTRRSGAMARCDRGGMAFEAFFDRACPTSQFMPGEPAEPVEPVEPAETGGPGDSAGPSDASDASDSHDAGDQARRWPTISVMVGPEGGWSPEERALVPDAVELVGPVLRAETAAIAAGVLLVHARSRLLR